MQQSELVNLIEQVLDGNHNAFDKLITEFRSMVLTLAYQKLGNFSNAEEVAQETFIKAWQNLRALKDKTRFPAWLCTITANLCTDYLRRNPRVVSLNGSTNNQAADINKDNKVNNNSTNEVMQAVRELTDLQQQVITLRFQKGMSGAEIARQLGQSPEAVRAALYRAIKTLRNRLKPL